MKELDKRICSVCGKEYQLTEKQKKRNNGGSKI